MEKQLENIMLNFFDVGGDVVTKQLSSFTIEVIVGINSIMFTYGDKFGWFERVRVISPTREFIEFENQMPTKEISKMWDAYIPNSYLIFEA